MARSKCRSQNADNTTFGALLEVSCSKSARRCGAKHIWKPKCSKHTILGTLLEVDMFKKCTPFWREAHAEIKLWKAHTTFGPLWMFSGTTRQDTTRHETTTTTTTTSSSSSRRCRRRGGGGGSGSGSVSGSSSNNSSSSRRRRCSRSSSRW